MTVYVKRVDNPNGSYSLVTHLDPQRDWDFMGNEEQAHKYIKDYDMAHRGYNDFKIVFNTRHGELSVAICDIDIRQFGVSPLKAIVQDLIECAIAQMDRDGSNRTSPSKS